MCWKQISLVNSFHTDVKRQSVSTLMCVFTWCRSPWEWNPSCVWSGRWVSWCGSPGWTAAALVWRWRTERAAGEPMSRLQKAGSDRAPTSDGRGSSGPGAKQRTEIYTNLCQGVLNNLSNLCWCVLPGSQRSCRAGSGNDSRSFSPGIRSFLEEWPAGRRSSRCCWSLQSSAHLHEWDNIHKHEVTTFSVDYSRCSINNIKLSGL